MWMHLWVNLSIVTVSSYRIHIRPEMKNVIIYGYANLVSEKNTMTLEFSTLRTVMQYTCQQFSPVTKVQSIKWLAKIHVFKKSICRIITKYMLFIRNLYKLKLPDGTTKLLSLSNIRKNNIKTWLHNTQRTSCQNKSLQIQPRHHDIYSWNTE